LPVAALKYSTKQEALQVLIDSAGVDTLCYRGIGYNSPWRYDPPIPGHPYMKAYCQLNWIENKCINAWIDLITGEMEIQNVPCWISK
jgi:hypothetical protein